MKKKYQVAIVGGGPVGVALAVQLGMRGISCALVESRTELRASPRARTSPIARSSISISWASSTSCAPRAFLPPGFAIGEITATAT